MKRVVIIGAGPAGLTAAKELLAGNEPYDITILEESNEIGGISRTVRYEGNRMDIGGHRFFSKSDEIMQRWAQWMPLQGAPSFDDAKLGREKPLAQGGPDPEKEDRVMLVRDRVSRIYYGNHFFDYPISMKWETIRNMGFATTMKAGFSYLKAMVAKRPETNLENFYINRFGKVLYSMFFEGYTEKLWGRHPSEIAADWGAQRVKGLSILSLLKNMLPKGKNAEVETSLIEQFWYPKFGPGQLWETLAADVQAQGAKLQFGHSVKRIVCEGGRVKAVVCDTPQGEQTLEGDIFISSMPVKDPEHTVWIGLEYFCAEGDSFWNMPEEECTAFAVSELEKMGVVQKGDVLASHRERVKKAYPAYFDTYEHMDEIVSFLNGFENLYCVGRNGQHRYNNMDHSMLTAIRAAEAIGKGGEGKQAIWNVNTEKSYHESKA